MKRSVLGVSVASTLVLLMAGLAWACTRQQTILALSPQFGHPGSAVNLQGVGATVTEQGARVETPRVEVRWNDAEGPVLATAVPDAEGRYSVQAQIPDAAPGVYFIVTLDSEGAVARHAFSVTAGPAPDGQSSAGTRSVLDHLWSGFSSATASGSLESVAPAAAPNPPYRFMGAGLLLVGLSVLSAAATFGYLRSSRRRARSG